MSQELWATYSVMDHLKPRPLAADVLLFDQLVFPVPEKASFPEGSAPANEPGAIEWTPDPEEWRRWGKEEWDPEGQKRLLDWLRPVVRKVSWDETCQEQWRAESARLAVQQLPGHAFVATRTVLTRDLPAYVTGVAAVGPSYRTIEEIQREMSIRDAAGRKRLPGGALATVLGWQFLAPEDPRLSDEQLLKKTVEFVTQDQDFPKYRRAFLDWQQGFLKDGQTDVESIRKAVKTMDELLQAANRAAARLEVRTVVRYAFRLAPSVVGAVLALAGVPGGPFAALGGAFLSLGSIAVDEWFLKDAEKDAPAPTAFVQHVNRHFGWE
jgi:hypothetical protein